MLRRTRILVNCLAALALAAAVFGLFWRHSFHCKTLVEGQTAYEPGFFYVSNAREIPFQKKFFRRIQKGKLIKDEEYAQVYETYDSALAEAELQQAGYENLGRLECYRRYPFGRVFVYEGWQRHPLYWNVVIAGDQGVRQFPVDRGDEADKLTRCTADESHLYLHRYTSRQEIVVVQLDLETGAQKNYYFNAQGLDTIASANNWFDPRTEQLMVFNRVNGKKELQVQRCQTGEKKIIAMKKPVDWLLASQDGFWLAGANHSGVAFYAYDLDWNPLPEQDIEISLGKTGIQPLLPLVNNPRDKEVQLADGVAYGCIEGEKALWYYAIDLEAGEPAALWQVRPPRKGSLELQDHVLFHRETGCEPYSTLF